MAVEGIIFSDLFITNKEMFVNFFASFYVENQEKIDKCILNLSQVLTQYTTKTVTEAMATSFKKAWDDFEHIVLLNEQDLQLIVAYRGAGGRDGQFSQIIKQSDVEGTAITGAGKQYGINAGHDLIKDSIKSLEASQIESFLQFHLNGLLNQLDKSITRGEAYLLHKYHTAQLNMIYAEHDEIHLTGVLWRAAFYGDMISNTGKSFYFSGQGLGKVYDAFMNHMANKETNIFNYLQSSGMNQAGSINALTHRNTTVYTEENEIGPGGNFPQLLKDSTNHTGWYTGGDIVIVNPETMGVVYNIQLKTTTVNKPSVFGERVEKIRKFLKGFQELTPRQKGERIFDFLLTSISNYDAFNSIMQEDIDEIITKQLQEKININLTF